MPALARPAAFVVGLLAVFALALGAGSLWGPTVAAPESHEAAEAGHDAGDEGGHAVHAASDPADLPGGLMRSQDGYTLDLADPSVRPGRGVPVSFTVTGPDGAPVTSYDVEHGKRLHLIVVRRDLTGFQHLHPTLDADSGRWSADVDVAAGTWRVFADFTPTGGPSLTLGTDLVVPGRTRPAGPTDGQSRTDRVDGYEVELTGRIIGGTEADLTLSVSRDGEPVTDLQPYLGAFGHLVALRAGDLAYLHVHPHESAEDASRGGPDVDFTAEVPSEGRYRLFLDFKHDGSVHTARFDVTASRS